MIELMVSLGIFSIVSLAAFSVLSSSQKTAVMNDQTVQVQRNVRLAVDLISRDLRMAGYGNPAAGVLAACPNHMNPTNSSTGSDKISVMTIDQPIGTLTSAFTTGSTITVSGLASDAANGDLVTLEGIFTGLVTVSGSHLTFATSITSLQRIPAGTQVIRLTCVTYTVTGADGKVGGAGTVFAPYQLLRNTTASATNAVPIVDGIESLQLAYAVDEDKDGKIDDKNGSGTFDSGDFLSTIPSSVNATPTSARQVRVTVVGRAIPPAAANTPNNCWYDSDFKSGAAVNAEDLALAEPVQPSTCPAPRVTGGIRRRVLSRIVSLRDAYTL